jgi:hypothetical protein
MPKRLPPLITGPPESSRAAAARPRRQDAAALRLLGPPGITIIDSQVPLRDLGDERGVAAAGTTTNRSTFAGSAGGRDAADAVDLLAPGFTTTTSAGSKPSRRMLPDHPPGV